MSIGLESEAKSTRSLRAPQKIEVKQDQIEVHFKMTKIILLFLFISICLSLMIYYLTYLFNINDINNKAKDCFRNKTLAQIFLISINHFQ